MTPRLEQWVAGMGGGGGTMGDGGEVSVDGDCCFCCREVGDDCDWGCIRIQSTERFNFRIPFVDVILLLGLYREGLK